jgi:hypothetical protein
MALTDTARGTANILSDRVAVNMSDKISMLEPEASPLLVLTKKLGNKTTSNYKFEWMEQDPMARWVSANTVSDIAADATTLPLQTDEGANVAVNDIIKVVRTGEILRVTDISTDSLTVTRGYGTTAGAVIKDDDKILIIGNALMQGSGSPAEKYNTPTPLYNYTQIFKTPFSITGTLENTKLIGGEELARERLIAGIEHAKSIEYALLFGERKLDTTGAQPLSTTAGVVTFLTGTDNVSTVAKADLVEADFETFCEEVFTYGSGEKVMFACPYMITKINTWAKGKLEIVQADKDKTYGLNIVKYMTPHGTLDIVKHPLFVQGYAGYNLVLDLDELSYRPLQNRDTKLQTNIQDNDEDGERDQYITESGLELRMPKKHGMFIVTGV